MTCYASMTPAKEVGGDFYDFFMIDDDHLALVIADVSGKGIPAALFMMSSKILIKNTVMTGKSPGEVLNIVNRQVCESNQEEMFVTVWLGILNIEDGTLVTANAGHEYPIVKTPGGDFELLKTKHSFVVGGMTGIKYKETVNATLNPAPSCLLYRRRSRGGKRRRRSSTAMTGSSPYSTETRRNARGAACGCEARTSTTLQRSSTV